MTAQIPIRSVSFALLLVLAAPLPAQDGLNLNVNLPEGVSWTLAADRMAGQSYSKEWIPAGEQIDSASWLITQQKVPVDGRTNAEDYLLEIYELSAQACTSATHEEMEQLRIGDVRVVVGRTICGQRLGTGYGAFTDRAIMVEAGFAYIITSELRVPPMIVDGIVSFGNSRTAESASAKEQFFAREESSFYLVRERIAIN